MKSGRLVNWRHFVAASESVTLFIFICKLPMSVVKCLPSTSSYKIDIPSRVRDFPPWQLTVVYRCNPNLRYKGILITQEVIFRSIVDTCFSEMLW
jgi:hypothetical protein